MWLSAARVRLLVRQTRGSLIRPLVSIPISADINSSRPGANLPSLLMCPPCHGCAVRRVSSPTGCRDRQRAHQITLQPLAGRLAHQRTVSASQVGNGFDFDTQAMETEGTNSALKKDIKLSNNYLGLLIHMSVLAVAEVFSIRTACIMHVNTCEIYQLAHGNKFCGSMSKIQTKSKE